MTEFENSDQTTQGDQSGFVELPAPTVWPMVLALGIALIFTGMVTHWIMGVLGALCILPAIYGWFREVLPDGHHISIPVGGQIIPVLSTRTIRVRPPLGEDLRKLLPIETFSVWAGIKGGIAGGFTMIIPAMLFGLLRHHSIWYAINLLAAGGFVSWAAQSDDFLSKFHPEGLIAATFIHAFASLLIGTLYGAMLPMYPRKPILTAGFIAPFLWTGLLYSALGVISPILNQRIEWTWFIASQVAFGLVAGYIVNLQVKIRTPQFQALPFSIRAGLHTDVPIEVSADRPEIK